MDIQVRFDDGTTRLFDGHTMCWVGLVATRTREEPIRQHRGATVWIPAAGRNGRVETADEQIARLDADVASLRRQLADETTRANIAERTAMAWEGRAKAAERALTTTNADRVVAMAAAKVRAEEAERERDSYVAESVRWAHAADCVGIAWAARGQTILCLQNRLRRWKRRYRRLKAPTLGDLINARARAGAEMVDAREALARIPKAAPLIREMAQARLDTAKEAYRRALDAEQAHGS